MRNKARHCDFCGTFYEGRGDQYCSQKCSAASAKGYRIVVLPDAHLEADRPVHPSYLAAERFVREVQPEVVVMLGDFLEMGCFSHWNKSKPKVMEGKRYVDDCRMGIDRLQMLRPACGRMVFMEGNHEDWLNKYVDEHPELEGKLDLRIDLGLYGMGIEYVPVNKVFSIGKVNLIHGWYTGKYHAKAHLDAMGDNIFYGHTHDSQSFIRPVRKAQDPHVAMSLGCLCSLNPFYRRNKPNHWVNGFGIFEVQGSGMFNPYFVSIFDGKFNYGGTVWKA